MNAKALLPWMAFKIVTREMTWTHWESLRPAVTVFDAGYVLGLSLCLLTYWRWHNPGTKGCTKPIMNIHELYLSRGAGFQPSTIVVAKRHCQSKTFDSWIMRASCGQAEKLIWNLEFWYSKLNPQCPTYALGHVTMLNIPLSISGPRATEQSTINGSHDLSSWRIAKSDIRLSAGATSLERGPVTVYVCISVFLYVLKKQDVHRSYRCKHHSWSWTPDTSPFAVRWGGVVVECYCQLLFVQNKSTVYN